MVASLNSIVESAQYYDKVDGSVKFLFMRSTNTGVYIPSPVHYLYGGLKKAQERDYIGKNDLFCDAGSGDGRVLALASLLGINSVGIESDAGLIYKTNIHFEQLENALETIPTVIKGDFLDNETYSNNGLDFSDINVFYNYVNNDEILAQKILKESPDGTRLLIFNGIDEAPVYNGLELIDTISLTDSLGLTGFLDKWSVKISHAFGLEAPKLFVYRK